MIAITLTDILRAERDRRNRLYPHLVHQGKMTSAEANLRWARFCTLLPRGGVGTDMHPRHFTPTDQAVAEYDRWITDELQSPALAPAVSILQAWLSQFRPSKPLPAGGGVGVGPTQGTLL